MFMLTRVSSAMPTTETSDEALIKRMNSLMRGGGERADKDPEGEAGEGQGAYAHSPQRERAKRVGDKRGLYMTPADPLGAASGSSVASFEVASRRLRTRRRQTPQWNKSSS